MNKLKWATPFLMVVFTVISMYAANIQRVDPGDMWFSMIYGFIVAGIFLLVFWLLKWTAPAASSLATIYALVFLVIHEVPLWLAITVMVLFTGILVFIKKTVKPVSMALFILACIMVMEITGFAIVKTQHESTAQVEHEIIPGQPNIYFIVPDRMPSPAAMRESGINPDYAIDQLRESGYVVPEALLSHDPYTIDFPVKLHTTRTMRFFASVLNNGITIPMLTDYKTVRHNIRYPILFMGLQLGGYTITNVASWFSETAEFPQADYNLRFDDVTLMERIFADEFSVAYFNRSLLAGLNFRVLQSRKSINNVEIKRHDWQKKQILAIAASGKTSQFIISHIMLPHEPFVYSFSSDDPMGQYKENIRYALFYIPELATKIRALDPTAYIIIQSDEGMAFKKPKEINYQFSNTQWNGVFAAWYFPGGFPKELNPDTIWHTDILHEVVVWIK